MDLIVDKINYLTISILIMALSQLALAVLLSRLNNSIKRLSSWQTPLWRRYIELADYLNRDLRR